MAFTEELCTSFGQSGQLALHHPEGIVVYVSMYSPQRQSATGYNAGMNGLQCEEQVKSLCAS